jgi:hypothetical protein
VSDPLDVQILNALMTRLTTPALTGNPSIASPQVAFTPVAGVAYLDAHPILRATPQRPWIAFDSDTVHRGIFQVDAVVPKNNGEPLGLRLAALVVARFDVGTILDLADGNRIKINMKPGIAPVIPDDAWARYPVSIPYFVVA